jgi:bifunctional UDP-N-acetylglucosamine pyrophosphorylase / glucosamine-1-phosphate N-acetyltransferase
MLTIVILAAGKGQRMQADLPKVMHKVAGVSMLARVLACAKSLKPDAVYIVHNHNKDALMEPEVQALLGKKVFWVLQAEQKGTGHAVMQALPFLPDKGTVLVLYADVPLLTQGILRPLLAAGHQLHLLTACVDNPSGMGRIQRDEKGRCIKIIEQKDATRDEEQIGEVWSGVMSLPARFLKEALPFIGNQNKQKEYYLTSLVDAWVKDKGFVHGHCTEDSEAVLGVNTPKQLSAMSNLFYHREEMKGI